MSVGIPLPELDVTKPTPAPFPDALSEFQRASALKTAAGQQQIQQQTVQSNDIALQQQQMQLADMKKLRDLAPQYVQKGDDGTVKGYDVDGLANAALGQGINPQTVAGLRNTYAESVKNLAGANKAQLDLEQEKNDKAFEVLEGLRGLAPKTPAAAPQVQGGPQAAPAQPQAAPQSPVAGTGGMPSFMLPNMPQGGGAQPAAQSMSEQPPAVAGIPQVQTTPEMMQGYHQAIMKLAHLGVNIGQLNPNQFPTDDQLNGFEAGLGTHKQALADAETLAKTQADTAKAGLDSAQAKAAGWKEIASIGAFYNPETNELRTPAGQVMSPAMLESRYVMNQAKKNAGQTLSPEDQAFDKGYEHMKTLVPAFNINMAAGGAGMIPGGAGAGGGGGAAGGTTAPKPTIDAVPGPIKGTVQQILDYRGQMPPAGRNNPTNNAIRYWVNALDPAHDDTFYPARNKMMTAMTSGPEATQINAINTALGHVGVLNEAIDALHNSDGGVKALRDLANKVGVQVGDTPVTTLQTIIHRVGPELTAAYVQGGGGEGERGTTAADFDPSLGNQQLKDNVAVTAKLLRSKIGSLENQYKNTMQRSDFEDRFMTPEARATLNKLSPTSSGGSGGGTGGGSGHVIQIGNQKYQYKGSGDTADLANYTQVTK